MVASLRKSRLTQEKDTFDRFTLILLLTIVADNLKIYGINNELIRTRLEYYEEEEYSGNPTELFTFHNVLDEYKDTPTIFAYLVNRIKFDLRGNKIILSALNEYLNK